MWPQLMSLLAFGDSCRYFAGEGEKELNWVKLNCILIVTLILKKYFYMQKTLKPALLSTYNAQFSFNLRKFSF